MSTTEPTGFDLAAARTFVQAATWTFATTYAAFAPHEYTTRWACRAKGIEKAFTAFAQTIEEQGYWRIWGWSRWRSLKLDDRTYWLYKVYEPAQMRTVINRWLTDQMSPESGQLSLEVER